MSKPLPQDTLFFPSQAAWEAWLDEQHATSPGIWLKLARTNADLESVSYPEALEGALCYGWIDGQKASLDETYWLQRFTPRKARSKWSKLNCEKAEALIASARMKPAGLQEVERAKADGRWEAAYDGPRSMPVPEDFQQALAQNPEAERFFAALDSRNRYAILYQIQDAKKVETRARQIEKFIALLSAHEKLYP